MSDNDVELKSFVKSFKESSVNLRRDAKTIRLILDLIDGRDDLGCEKEVLELGKTALKEKVTLADVIDNLVAVVESIYPEVKE